MKIRLQPIYPKYNQFNVARYEREIKAVQEEVKTGIHQDFQKTVATWSHKPTFTSTRRGYVYYVSTKDKQYAWVDRGTKAHLIPKVVRPGRRLAFFATGFKAKTKVNVIGSYRGRAASSNFVRPKQVRHPGTKARNFSKRIAEKWQKTWTTRLWQAIRRAAKSPGKR